MHRLLIPALIVLAGSSCKSNSKSLGLIYLNGRAVEPAGDSVLAMTTQGLGGLILYHMTTGAVDTIAAGVLTAPVHVQFVNARWYVSDLVENRPSIAVLSWSGELEREFDLEDLASSPHQFAVLPDERVIVQTTDGELVALGGDSVTTFALVETSQRPGLLAGIAGGVLHMVPLVHITFYNEFGHIRWRLPWQWAETAYFTDITTDMNGRIHIIAGIPSDEEFVVYTLGRNDGEILRWSRPGPYATFTVLRNGSFRPDSAENWIGGGS